jgi:hypothetical protein
LRNSLIESKLRGELKQEEFREMADMIARDIEGIEAAQRAFVAEAEAALQLTADTSRTTIPAKALWASAHLTDKLTVQNALFPEGILYRTDIRFFEPPDISMNCKPWYSGYFLQTKRNQIGKKSKVVGAPGFEPRASCAQGRHNISWKSFLFNLSFENKRVRRIFDSGTVYRNVAPHA